MKKRWVSLLASLLVFAMLATGALAEFEDIDDFAEVEVEELEEFALSDEELVEGEVNGGFSEEVEVAVEETEFDLQCLTSEEQAVNAAPLAMYYARVLVDWTTVYAGPTGEDSAGAVHAGDVVLVTEEIGERYRVAFCENANVTEGYIYPSEIVALNGEEALAYQNEAALGAVVLYLNDANWPLKSGDQYAVLAPQDNNPEGYSNPSSFTNRKYSGIWLWPLGEGYRSVSSYVGGRLAPLEGASSNHHGTDIPAPEGTPIYAARGGYAVKMSVLFPNMAKGLGNWVAIDHGDGFYTAYGHMSRFSDIYESDGTASVNAGDIIGFVGVTGTAKGAHLHFEIAYNWWGAGQVSRYGYTWGGTWGTNGWEIVDSSPATQSYEYSANASQYNGQNYQTATNLCFKDVVYPKTFRIDTINGWNLSGGALVSNADLTSIKTMIVDGNGNVVSSGSRSLSGRYYSIQNLDTFSSDDNGVKFSRITGDGNYKWILIATDSSNRTLRLVMPFTAVGNGSTSTANMSKEYADYYTVKSENVTYQIIKKVTARKKPFSDSEKGSTLNKGKTVTSEALVINKYNNLWIRTNDNQYIYAGYHVEDNDTISKAGEQYLEVYSGTQSTSFVDRLLSFFGILNVNAATVTGEDTSDATHGGGGGTIEDSGSSSSTTGEAASGQWTYKVVTSDGLNMRDSAGTHGTLITTLWNPTTIAVSKKQSADGYTWGYGTSSNGYTGWIVVDNNWTTVVSKPVDTTPEKHSHSPITISGYAATCVKEGLTDGSKCSTCGEVLTAQKSIPAKGHSPQTVKGKAATCTAAGLTDGSKCSVCGEVLTAQKSIPAKGHSPQTVKGKAATCTAAGLTDGSKCSVCGEVLTAQKSIPATGHTPVGVAGYAPTYEAPGLTDGSYCAVCGVTLVPQQVIPQLEWPARVLEKNKNNGTVTVNLGEKVHLVPQFAYAAGAEVTGFRSGKAKVAGVDGGGLVTALAEGKAKITVTTSNKKQKATITVVVVDPFKPTGIGIAQGKAITLTMGQPVQLGVGLTPATARATLTWKSNKAKVATVDGNGVVYPVGEGKAKITVTTHNKKKATIAVTVVDPYKPLGVSIAQGKTLTIKVNQTALLSATLNPASAQSALTWQSSKPSVVFVDSNGIIAGVKKGKAKITVTTYNKKKATITVNVVD